MKKNLGLGKRIGLAILGMFVGAGAVQSLAADIAVWRDTQRLHSPILLRLSSAGHLLPGTTGVNNLGSSSFKYAAIYGNDVAAAQIHLLPKAVTANTTLVVADGNEIRVGSIAGNISIVIPSAVTAGNGAVLDVQDVGGVLDATHALAFTSTSGNINGSASALAYSTAYGGKRFISDGTNWFAR